MLHTRVQAAQHAGKPSSRRSASASNRRGRIGGASRPPTSSQGTTGHRARQFTAPHRPCYDRISAEAPPGGVCRLSARRDHRSCAHSVSAHRSPARRACARGPPIRNGTLNQEHPMTLHPAHRRPPLRRRPLRVEHGDDRAHGLQPLVARLDEQAVEPQALERRRDRAIERARSTPPPAACATAPSSRRPRGSAIASSPPPSPSPVR
jgi:hypothetical protein